MDNKANKFQFNVFIMIYFFFAFCFKAPYRKLSHYRSPWSRAYKYSYLYWISKYHLPLWHFCMFLYLWYILSFYFFNWSIVDIQYYVSSIAQSCPTLWPPWTAACQASLSITNSHSFQTHVHGVGDAIQPYICYRYI